AGETTIAGRHADLQRLDALAAHFGIGRSSLGLVAPLHSPLVADAVAPWAAALRALPWGGARRAMHSPIDRGPYAADADMAAALAANLARPLHFEAAL